MIPSTGQVKVALTERLAELLIDCREDRTLRALLVGMLRKGNHH